MQNTAVRRLERGVFTLSLDFELIWGTQDLFGPEGFRQACEKERAVVIDRLLELFAEFEIPATWCTLGHLFLDHCTASGGRKHPEIVRPAHAWSEGDWFQHDPCSTEQSHPNFYGKSLVDKILACPVPQEVGCHTFSHIVFGDSGCSRATAESEIAMCVRLAKERGIEMKSFAFPRNSIGHLDVLRDAGFTCYRGPEPHELKFPKSPADRLRNLWDVFTARCPPVFLPEHTPSGLWNIPGSMMYFPMHGFRRFIPTSVRIKRAKRGLKAAADQKKVFHLWFHPTNMADEMERMFAGLRTILQYAAALRGEDRLMLLPMGALAVINHNWHK